jgi:hypothetical protein
MYNGRRKERQLTLVNAAEDQLLPALRNILPGFCRDNNPLQSQSAAVCKADQRQRHHQRISPGCFSALEPALPGAESLVLNGIGEPLLPPQLEDFIRTAKRLMPEGSW